MYTAQDIDIEKFEEYLCGCEDREGIRKVEKQKVAEAYFAGYREAISVARDALHCSNYEKEGIATYEQGINDTIYELAKELDIPSQDLRDSGLSLDEMCALFANRIKESFGAGHTDEAEEN